MLLSPETVRKGGFCRDVCIGADYDVIWASAVMVDMLCIRISQFPAWIEVDSPTGGFVRLQERRVRVVPLYLDDVALRSLRVMIRLLCYPQGCLSYLQRLQVFCFLHQSTELPMFPSEQQPLRLPPSHQLRHFLPLPTFSNRNHLNRMLAVKIP